jgi:hypothetical protein
MKKETIEAVEACPNAMKQKDLSLAPLAERIAFEDPISGKNTGAENFRAFLSGFLPAIDDVRIHGRVCEDDFVVTHWEVDGVFGIIPILEKFRVRDGKLVEALGFFDPRPIPGS